MAKLSAFTRNSAAVSDGSPIIVGPEGNTFTLVTRGYTNEYADRLWELRRAAAIRLNSNLMPNQTPVSPDFLPPSEEDACVAQAIAEKCLLDVRDLNNPDGSPVTLADYCSLMKDRANRPLLALAMQAAGAVGRATKDQLEAAEKN